jgi:hypothetical protein
MFVPVTRKKQILIFVSCLLAVGLCGYAYFSIFGPDEFVWRDRIREGQQLVMRVESFRQEHHRLPESLEEAGCVIRIPCVFITQNVTKASISSGSVQTLGNP